MLRNLLDLLTVLARAFFCISNTASRAQGAADDANASNKPLNLADSFNVENYYAPGLFGAGAPTNDFLLRPAVPPAPNGLAPLPQIPASSTVAHSGNGVPIWQIFAGLNISFG